MRKNHLSKIVIALLGIFFCTIAFILLSNNRDYSEFKQGDLIFQTSHSVQSNAIMAATASVITHMGIIDKTDAGYMVIDAGKMVQQTPLTEWIERGVLGRYTVYRHTKLTPEQAARITKDAKTYIGVPYDLYFSFDNGALYCSELPYITFKKEGIAIGKVTKVSELNINNSLVENIIETRWEDHTMCRNKSYSYKECRERIINDSLVTPSSIADDANMQKIYSNYLFF
jgi:Permuted papain-like amidase enzyme, YaeF/YiiX, C92 family